MFRGAENLDVSNMTKGTLPRVPFAELYKEILGPKYELSISFVSTAKMRGLSQTYKGDPTHINVLSFPLSKNSGEIVISLAAAKAECLLYGRGCNQHVAFLVIHGMLHLAGQRHGSTMEAKEKRLMKSFGF